MYADTPGQLEGVLRFAPAQPRLPVVHLNRGVSLLEEHGRAVVRNFAGHFAGRITGLVVHDRRAMGELAGEWLAAMRELDAFLGQEAPTSRCSSSTRRAWNRAVSPRWRSVSRTPRT